MTWTEPFAELRTIHEAWLQVTPWPRTATTATNPATAGKPTKDAISGSSRLERALLAAQDDDGHSKRNHRPSIDLAGGSNSLFMVGDIGFEPITSTTSMWRSSQMS